MTTQISYINTKTKGTDSNEVRQGYMNHREKQQGNPKVALPNLTLNKHHRGDVLVTL